MEGCIGENKVVLRSQVFDMTQNPQKGAKEIF